MYLNVEYESQPKQKKSREKCVNYIKRNAYCFYIIILNTFG